jgi:hypothetical protein
MPENTTATTTSQIMFPGLEAAISAIITPIIATNNAGLSTILGTVATNISALSGKVASPVISRNNNEISPYPTFAIWTNQNNDTKAGFNIVNSDFQSIGSNAMPGWFGSYQDPSLSNMPNWYEDHRGQTYTNSQNSSGQDTTYSGGSTVAGSADGHNYYRPCLHGGFAGNWMNHFTQHANFTTRCGTVIGVRGVRQRVSHWSQDAEFQVRSRGMVTGHFDRVSLNNATYATWAGRPNRGMSSYNDRTKMLAVAESTTSGNNIRLHVWRNTDLSLNDFSHKPGTLHKFLSQAKTAGPTTGNQLSTTKNYAFYDFTWAQTGSTRNEPAYHMKLIMGDNGTIGFARFNHDGYAQRYGYFLPTSQGSAGSSGIGTFTDTEVNLGNTTSYGIDQSERYGIRHQNTWNNEWIATYSPYYYYESGINCHLINTVDPTKLFYFRVTNTSSGHGLVPFKEDKFLTIYSEQNGDGPGPYLYVIDPGSAAKNLRRTDGTTLSFGGDLQPYNIPHYYQFDTHSNTTQYAHLVSMPHWSNP